MIRGMKYIVNPVKYLLIIFMGLELLTRVYFYFYLRKMPSFFSTFQSGVAEYDERLGYRLKRNFSIRGQEKINALGFRGPECAVTKDPDTIRMVAVGGSTTYGFGVKDEETYPYQLQKKIGQIYQHIKYKKLEIINAGVSGYHSYHHILRFPELLALKPDVILLHVGWNDFGVALIQGDSYFPNSLQGSGTLFLPTKENLLMKMVKGSTHYFASLHILKQAYTNMLWRKSYQAILNKTVPSDNLSLVKKSWDPPYKLILENFKKNLETLIQLTKDSNIKLIMVTMPFMLSSHAYQEEHQQLLLENPHSEENLYRVYYAEWHRQMDELEKTLAQQHHLSIIDASKAFEGMSFKERKTFFIDQMHLNSSGVEKLTEILAENLKFDLERS